MRRTPARRDSDPDLIFYGSYSAIWSFQVTQEIMAKPPRPDAIFAANNFIGLGVLEALRTMGIRVPEDVAGSASTTLPSTQPRRPSSPQSCSPHRRWEGSRGRLLLDRLADPDREIRELVLPTELIIRTSCGCIPDRAAGMNEALWGHPRS